MRLSEIMRLGGGAISEETIATQNRLEGLRQREALDDVVNYVKFAKAEIAKIETLATTVDVIKDGVNDIVGYLATEFGILGKEEQAKQRAERREAQEKIVAPVVGDAPKIRAPGFVFDLLGRPDMK